MAEKFPELSKKDTELGGKVPRSDPVNWIEQNEAGSNKFRKPVEVMSLALRSPWQRAYVARVIGSFVMDHKEPFGACAGLHRDGGFGLQIGAQASDIVLVSTDEDRIKESSCLHRGIDTARSRVEGQSGSIRDRKFTSRNAWKFCPNMSFFHRVNTTVGEKRPRQVLQGTRTPEQLPFWRNCCARIQSDV